MKSDFLYILDGKKAVPCKSVLEWGEWMETANRNVIKTIIGDTRVSTVFLGMNCSFSSHQLLFETMVFGGKYDGDQYRTGTWEEAEQMHEDIVRKISDEISVKELERREKLKKSNTKNNNIKK